MGRRKNRYYMGDFETTVYTGQTSTEVWASAVVELYHEDVKIFHSIDDTYKYLCDLHDNIIIYYHNLKFDGSFWLDFLLKKCQFHQALEKVGKDTVAWKKDKEMLNGEIKYSISDRGQWYNIVLKINNKIIEIRDSLKLIPLSVAETGKAFNTKRRKLEMDYEGFRYAGCEITDDERQYIANDVLVMKEALEVMFSEGHDRLTIGSCCLAEYKEMMGDDYKVIFPNCYEMQIDKKRHGCATVGEWVHNGYKGAWCYLAKGKANKIYRNGLTADVNSLYPSMMHSESGNKYPTGVPKFWTGNYIPDEAIGDNKFYYIRIKTRFYLKPGYLPFIQIKGTWQYKGTEMLESSDFIDKKTGERSAFYFDFDGVKHDTRVELTLTEVDYRLIQEHYNLVDFEILDGCYFWAQVGLFDEYINKYRQQKLTATGGRRTIAKLFLNNLYGKMAASMESNFKLAYVREDGILGFTAQEENGKMPGYIPVGAAITSYARNFTIRAAQKNYHGVDKPGFIYADTDSIHCDLQAEELIDIPVHDKNFCCWKLESSWDKAIFVRQKTYIEHIVAENLKPISEPKWNITCAGMPTKCKKLFEMSMEGIQPDEEAQKKYDSNELRFLERKRELKDFRIGLEVPGKLFPKRLPGGITLVNTTYKLRA